MKHTSLIAVGGVATTLLVAAGLFFWPGPAPQQGNAIGFGGEPGGSSRHQISERETEPSDSDGEDEETLECLGDSAFFGNVEQDPADCPGTSASTETCKPPPCLEFIITAGQLTGVPGDKKKCDEAYGEGNCYFGAEKACVCNHGSDEPWSQKLRQCLQLGESADPPIELPDSWDDDWYDCWDVNDYIHACCAIAATIANGGEGPGFTESLTNGAAAAGCLVEGCDDSE